MSNAEDAELEIEGLGGELMPFQRAGVAYALERRRVFLADEQGLGKTIQALATVQADRAYPAVVVCPASLKLNWLREIENLAAGPQGDRPLGPHRAGPRRRGPRRPQLRDRRRAPRGAQRARAARADPRRVPLREEPAAPSARKAILELVENLGPDALRLALTGTPVVNRPAELAPQLRALDRLGEYGTMSSFTPRLRVAGLPAKAPLAPSQLLLSPAAKGGRPHPAPGQAPRRRARCPLRTTAEYRRAERDFIRWLSEQVDTAAAVGLTHDARAQALIKMTALRRLAARGKLDAALTWIDDFAESGERLVVFAHHREIQAAVIERFPESARIVGDDSMDEREANVRRFQGDDGPELCVCSLGVASHGFTLTAAANVAFLELDWTPAKHDQAEDRVHRIGQAESVTAWYLLANETIDERIATLLAEKRDVVDSVTDGGTAAGTSLAASADRRVRRGRRLFRLRGGRVPSRAATRPLSPPAPRARSDGCRPSGGSPRSLP